MKRRLLELLVCPRCGSRELALDAPRGDSGPARLEIETGILRCGSCDRCFPIVGGIPRLLPDSWDEHRERIATSMAPTGVAGDSREIRDFRARQGAIRRCFDFEWLHHRATDQRESLELFRRHTGLGPAELAGKRVLDAGCGVGRFLEIAAAGGAEVVGMDLSRAVEGAWRQAGHPERTHLVQGDILRPPFAPESFDVIFSIGVLHHTTDTRSAFRALVPLLKPGGRIAVWVYRRFQPEIEVGLHKRAFELVSQMVSDGTRVITTRLPHGLLRYLCYAAVPLGWLRLQIGTRPVLKHLLWPLLLPPVSSHPDWRVRVRDTFDWLSPKYQWKHTTREVSEWFAAEGLEEIHAPGHAVSVGGVKPALNKGEHDRPGSIERAAG